MKLSGEPLDQTRQAWLANLAREHRLAGSGTSALALARGEWMCGEYDRALDHFLEARDRRPDDPETHLSLMRAASMLDQPEVEEAATTVALAAFPTAPLILLHAGLRLVPQDAAGARALLSRCPPQGLASRYLAALNAIEGQALPTLPSDDPRHAAECAGLRWLMERTRDVRAYAGLGPQVLRRALDAAAPEGLTIECGVYFGRSLRSIAAHSPGRVHGFDSFQGLPEAWNANEGPGAYSTAGRLPRMPANVSLHAGWFEDTLPPFFAANAGPIRLLHIDCDLYSSTRTVLEHAGPRLVAGSIVVFDDLLGYPGFEQHELRAFVEWAAERSIGWEVVAAALLGREVAIRITQA